VSQDIEGNLWPFYVVADESGSMYAYMDELNEGLGSLRRALLAQPLTAAKIRFTLIGFSDDAIVRSHLVDMREAAELTPLESRIGTCYQAAFNLLRELIPADVETLKARRYAVYRPTVFFLSDGEPNDALDWPNTHRQLVDRTVHRAAPNIIACGIGDVRADVIRQVATQPQYAFVTVPGVDIGQAITEFCTALTKSVVASVQTFGTGADSLIVEPPAGFRVTLDEV